MLSFVRIKQLKECCFIQAESVISESEEKSLRI